MKARTIMGVALTLGFLVIGGVAYAQMGGGGMMGGGYGPMMNGWSNGMSVYSHDDYALQRQPRPNESEPGEALDHQGWAGRNQGDRNSFRGRMDQNHRLNDYDGMNSGNDFQGPYRYWR